MAYNVIIKNEALTHAQAIDKILIIISEIDFDQ